MTTPFSNRPGADQAANVAAVLGLLGERDPLEVLAENVPPGFLTL